MSGLSGRPLQLTQTNPLLVFAYSLIDVAFEPGFFGGHLTPHDAPARACARARTASETHDSWRVLLAIADDAGGDLPRLAREAAQALPPAASVTSLTSEANGRNIIGLSDACRSPAKFHGLNGVTQRKTAESPMFSDFVTHVKLGDGVSEENNEEIEGRI